jgi:bacillithiol biosynthesis cysteine-adding enzyme BshC
MIQLPHMIPVEELGGETKLFVDYVTGRPGPVRSALGGFERTDPQWKEAADGWDPSRQIGVGTWNALVDRLVEYNRSIGVSEEVIDKLRRTAGEGARFVVTGQQPGLLGGPLLTLHKVATAVAVAEHFETTTGTPCIPLYWMGADDVDFQEIRELFVVDCDLTPLVTAVSEQAHQSSSPVGDISNGAIRDVWESVEPLVATCPYGEYVSGVVARALDGAADHGAVTARIICALTGGRAAVVDGRESAVRLHARDLFLRYFDDERLVREQLAEAGRSLEADGYHAQLWLGPDSGVFLVDEGRRKKIVEDRRRETRELLSTDPSRFSPGVALRNLVQDSVFQPVAVVLGPAEIAYRAQLGGVYRTMSVHRPVAFPRMQGTYLTPAVSEWLRTVDAGSAVRLLTDPNVFVKSVYASQRPAEIEEAEANFRRAFQSASDEFVAALEGKLDRKSVEKSKKRLADIARRLDQTLNLTAEAGRTAALGRWPFLGSLGDYVRRKDKPQDRYLSALVPFLASGADAGEKLATAATAFVNETLDGRLSHVVYSA